MDLEQLRQIFNKLLPNEKETANKLTTLLGTFFSEKEDLLKLEKEQYAPAFVTFADKHNNLLVLLDYIDNRIKDRQIGFISKNLKK